VLVEWYFFFYSGAPNVNLPLALGCFICFLNFSVEDGHNDHTELPLCRVHPLVRSRKKVATEIRGTVLMLL